MTEPELPAVRPRSWRVADADAFLPALDRLLDSVEAAVLRQRDDDGPATAPEVLLSGLLTVLDEAGVVVRDLQRRLVDFPTVGPDGEVVLLCRTGEESRIAWWHDPTAGYAGRRSLDDDPPW